MIRLLALAAIVLAALAVLRPAAANELRASPEALKELAPDGILRVGVAVGAAVSAFWATRDEASGNIRGVTVDLGTELARALQVPVELVVFANSGEITNAGATGAWDVTFMPVDAERQKVVDFGPAYYLFESTYMVAPGSPIGSLAEVDRPGVRVAAVDNTTTMRSAERVLKNATIVRFRTVDEIVEAMRGGSIEAVALSREALASLVQKLPGARILPGSFHASSVAIAVPKGRPAALALVTSFIEMAKASGSVRRALDAAGLRQAQVAPQVGR